MRKAFQEALLELMSEQEDVYLLIGDLGYRIFDRHRETFPNRVINCGAAEQTMMGMAVGLSQVGRHPFVYSITPFLLYRPFETIRTYINHERVRITLVGSGRDKDYAHDGMSHWAEDDREIMKCLPNIMAYWPEKGEFINKSMLETLTMLPTPSYLNLRR